MKKLLTLIMTLVVSLTLLACDKKASYNVNVPTGNLTGEYAKLGDNVLYVTDVYNKIRSVGFDFFKNEIIEKIIPDTFDKATDGEELKEIINKACYGVKDITTLSDRVKKDKYARYQDEMTLIGIDLQNVAAQDVYNNEAVINFYKGQINARKYAKGLIEDTTSPYYYANEYKKDKDGKEILVDGEKVKNPTYIDDEKLESHYNSVMKNDKPFKSIVIGFRTLAEAEAAIKAAGATLDAYGAISYAGDMQALFDAMFDANHDYKNKADAYELTDEKIKGYNSTLITLLNDLETGEYTKRPVQIGDLVYLVYQIEAKAKVEFKDASKDEVRADLIKKLADETFINDIIAELLNDLDITIYDPLFDALYAKAYEKHERLAASAWKDEYKNNVASFKYNGKDYTITVADFYNEYEKQFGVTATMDYFINQSLLTSSAKDKVTADDEKKFKESYKNNLKAFNNNELPEYPSSIGEENFKVLYYGKADEKTALDYYRAQKIWEYTSKDYPDDIFATLEKFGKNFSENYFDLSVKHVLFFVDYDMDGTPDDPQLFTSKLEDVAAFETALKDLANTYLAEVHYLVDNDYKDYEEALDYVKDQYTKNGEIHHLAPTTWTTYKKYNIGIKVEDLGQVNNGNASKYVKEFGVGVKQLYDYLVTEKLLDPTAEKSEDVLPKDYIAASIGSVDELISTEFGYHTLLAYDSDAMTSATYKKDDDTSELYNEIKIKWNDEEITLNAYTEQNEDKSYNSYANQNQWKIYVAEMLEDGSVNSLPSDVKTFIGYIYSDFTSRYTNKKFQNIYFAKLYLVNKLSFTNTAYNDTFAKFLEIQTRQFENYLTEEEIAKTTFAGWWDCFKAVEK